MIERVLYVLSSLEAQWAAEREEPVGNVPARLAAEYLNARPLASPWLESLTSVLESFPENLPRDVIPAQHDPYWRQVMATAGEALQCLAPGWQPPDVSVGAFPSPIGSWEQYFSSMLDKPVHPLYLELDRYLTAGGKALELAAGVGQGALHLLQRGLRVWACDIHGEPLSVLYERTPAALRSRLHVRLMTFENLNLRPGFFDVVAAGFCLFFMSREMLDSKWPMLVDSLCPGGLFMGQFLGVNDDWSALGYTAHTREEVETLLAGFDILNLDEVERRGKTSQGTEKHWHIFHVIARRRDIGVWQQPTSSGATDPWRPPGNLH